MKDENRRLLKSYNWEHPFPLTLKAYDSRPSSEKRYAVVLAHNSAQHAWNYLISIWEMIYEEMLNHLKSTNELLKEGLSGEKIKNHLISPETIKRLRSTPVHITSFYIYARIFLDRSAAIYPVLTFYRKMPPKKRESLPKQYYWLKENKSKDDLPYFQILERHWDNLDKNIIHPRNKLISHSICSTEQFRMGSGETPKIRYETFSLEDETFMLELLKKYRDLIGERIVYPKQDAPNTIKMLIEHGDKLNPNELAELVRIKNKMIEELPAIEVVMEQVDSFRLDLDKYYSTLIDKGILTSCD